MVSVIWYGPGQGSTHQNRLRRSQKNFEISEPHRTSTEKIEKYRTNSELAIRTDWSAQQAVRGSLGHAINGRGLCDIDSVLFRDSKSRAKKLCSHGTTKIYRL